MSYKSYFSEINILIEKIAKLEQEFRFCIVVKDYQDKLKIEKELGLCYRKLMRCVEKEGLQRIWIEYGILQFMIKPKKF